MLSKEILNSHTLKTLKSEIKKHNDKVKVSGYSKLTKPKIVELMMKHKDKFMHIKHAEKKEKKAPKAKAPKGTHQMPDGTVMTGKVHSKDSKPVKKEEPKKKKGFKVIKKEKKEEKPKEKKDINCIKSINNAKSVIELYETHKGILKNSVFKSKKDVNETMKQIVLYMTDSRCSKEDKAIMKKAFDLQQKPKEEKKEKKEAKPKPKGRKKTVKILTLAKGQGTSTKIGNVIGPDGKSYEPSEAAKLWENEGFKRAELSKADLKKTQKLAIKYGPFGEYGLGNQLDIFLKNKF